jgi:biopolymer transport protein ExbD
MNLIGDLQPNSQHIMARRRISEINAGSMADIAFLLLIFFLGTTTMEIDSGIAKPLPLHLENPPPSRPIIERNVLRIDVNLNDELMVEGNNTPISELENTLLSFYRDNANGMNNNPDMPMHEKVFGTDCVTQIGNLESRVSREPNNRYLQQELKKWQTKLKLCNTLGGAYMEMSKSSLIRFEYHSKTSFGLYMEIQNTMKKMVNQLRVEKCQELGWPDYFELNDADPKDQEKIKMLRIMIPERILEAKI